MYAGNFEHNSSNFKLEDGLHEQLQIQFDINTVDELDEINATNKFAMDNGGQIFVYSRGDSNLQHSNSKKYRNICLKNPKGGALGAPSTYSPIFPSNSCKRGLNSVKSFPATFAKRTFFLKV